MVHNRRPDAEQVAEFSELTKVELARFVKLFEETFEIVRAAAESPVLPSVPDRKEAAPELNGVGELWEVWEAKPSGKRAVINRFQKSYDALRNKLENAGVLIEISEGHQEAVRDRLVRAAVNMERSVEALGPALAAVDTPVSPQLARSLQATENAWRDMADEFGLLTSIEVSEFVGSKSPNRSYASEQRASGKLIAVRRPGGYRYPGFQFDPSEHAIRPVMQELIAVAKDADYSEADLALWLCAATGYLDGVRPVDRLDFPEVLVEAARQSFNVVW